jgi:aldehyde dehydrogenase (NAD+)
MEFSVTQGALEIAPAIATGIRLVLKPAETTSLTCPQTRQRSLKKQISPPGVVNIVTGAGAKGAAIV